MALGVREKAGNDVIFVDLKFAPNKGRDFVGFRQIISKIPRENAKEGERQFDYNYKTYDYVSGEITNFRVKEEPRYKSEEKEMIGYLTIRDLDNGPDVVVRFPLFGQAGRKLVGLVAAAVEARAGAVYLYTTFADAGTKIGDKVLEEPKAFINAKIGDAKGEKLTPLYYDENGRPMLDEKGNPKPLPMGEKHVIARKEVWDFSAAENVVSQTALVLVEHFKRDFESMSETENSSETFAEGDEDDDDIDLDEAVSAAMR